MLSIESEQGYSDGELFVMMHSGDNTAATTLYDRYKETIEAASWRYHVDVDDLGQEAWYKALAGFNNYDQNRDFSVWFKVIVNNVALDRKRREKCRIFSVQCRGVDDDIQLTERADLHTNDTQFFEVKDEMEFLLSLLSEPYRLVIQRVFSGDSIEEIATDEKREASTIRVRVGNARRILQAAFNARYSL